MCIFTPTLAHTYMRTYYIHFYMCEIKQLGTRYSAILVCHYAMQ